MSTQSKPLIHLNGSSKQHLVEQYREAWRAATEALNKLIAAAPNQRDYYPLGEEAWRRARAEHEQRAEHLRAIIKDMAVLSVHCDRAYK